jgi:hypothetical protein
VQLNAPVDAADSPAACFAYFSADVWAKKRLSMAVLILFD